MSYQLRFNTLSHEEKLEIIDAKNSRSPFNKFVGNYQAIDRLGLAAYSALGHPNHLCKDHNFALLGPASVGKTTLARLFGKVLGLPFCEIHPKSIKLTNDILVEIAKTCENTYTKDANGNLVSLALDPVRTPSRNEDHYLPPPMIVFIDEVHELKDNVVQGLLKATEQNDRVLYTEKGWIADTSNICWIIATTDRGALFDAFDTRFTKIHLRPYTKSEVAKIINIKYSEWTKETCNFITHYAGNVPREALSFAADVKLMVELKQTQSTNEVIAAVAEMREIDQFGLTRQRVNILKELGQQGPIAVNRLTFVAECKKEELEKYILPPMLVTTADGPALISVSPQGYTITKSGLNELDKRKIPHLGDSALPKNMRNLITERFGPDGLQSRNN